MQGDFFPVQQSSTHASSWFQKKLAWFGFPVGETWRLIVSCVLALVIYVLFSWLPNFVALLLTAALLCAFGQFDVNIEKHKK